MLQVRNTGQEGCRIAQDGAISARHSSYRVYKMKTLAPGGVLGERLVGT